MPALPSVDRRLRFFEAVRQVLAALSRERTPIVVLGGLERADCGTVELTAYLGDARAPWDAPHGEPELRALVLGTVEQSSSSLTWEGAPLGAVLQLPVTTTVPIAALDRDGVAGYLGSEAVVDAVLRRTGGLPGRIDRLVETESLPFEASVEREADALSPGARALVEALSVYARPASLDEMERLAGETRTHAVRTEAAASPLLERLIVDGKTLFDFRDTSARRVVRRSIERRRRTALHRACAELCAETPDGEVDAARHALRAGDAERAAELALAAWPELWAAHTYSTAAELLEPLSRSEMPLTHAVQRRLIALYRVTGDDERALALARALRESAGPSVAIALTMGELLIRRGELDEAAKSLEEGSALAMESGDPSELAETLLACAKHEYRRRDLAGAERHIAEALKHAREAKSLPFELDAHELSGLVAMARGRVEAAAQILRDTAERAERAGLSRHQATALNGLGVAEITRGHAAAAEHAFTHALRIESDDLGEEDRANLAREPRCARASATRLPDSTAILSPGRTHASRRGRAREARAGSVQPRGAVRRFSETPSVRAACARGPGRRPRPRDSHPSPPEGGCARREPRSRWESSAPPARRSIARARWRSSTSSRSSSM